MCRFNILGTAVNAHTYVLTDLDILILSGFALKDTNIINIIYNWKETTHILYHIRLGIGSFNAVTVSNINSNADI